MGTTAKSDAPAPETDSPSVDALIERYKGHLEKTLLTTVVDEKTGSKKTNGIEHYRSLCERLDALKLALTQKSWKDFLDEQAWKAANEKGEKGEAKRLILQAAKDAQNAAVVALQAKDMNDLSEDDLLITKAYLVRRPISSHTQKKLSVQYVTNLVHTLIRFLTHAEKRYGWQAPRHWIDNMKFARNQKKNMMSLAEQSAINEMKDHMTKEDLEWYWSCGTKIDKTFQGLAYWCAWTQVELATFRKVEFYLGDDKEYYIDKGRSKTGKWGKWWIPKPIADLVIDAMARTTDDPVKNPDGLAFLTGNHLPLIHAGDETDPLKQKTDYVSTYSWGPISAGQLGRFISGGHRLSLCLQSQCRVVVF
jgi:hypothetical protein